MEPSDVQYPEVSRADSHLLVLVACCIDALSLSVQVLTTCNYSESNYKYCIISRDIKESSNSPGICIRYSTVLVTINFAEGVRYLKVAGQS